MKPQISYHRPVPIWTSPFLWFIFASAVVVLSYYSVVPAGPSNSITHYDKFLHGMSYMLLTGLFGLAMPRITLFKVFLIPSLYGAFIELVQGTMTQGRTGSLLDMLANMSGAAFSVLIFWITAHLIHKVR